MILSLDIDREYCSKFETRCRNKAIVFVCVWLRVLKNEGGGEKLKVPWPLKRGGTKSGKVLVHYEAAIFYCVVFTMT